MLCRLALDNQKGRKLELRWEGPYIVDSINYHKESVVLKSLHEHSLVGKYHVNDVKKFIVHPNYEDKGYDQWLSLARKSHEQQKLVKEALEVQAQEEEEGAARSAARLPDPEWWSEFMVYPEAENEEQNPAYWSSKAIHLLKLHLLS